MTQVEDGLAALERQCQAAVDQFIARHRSQILTRAEFCRRTFEHLRQGNAADPYKAATGIYSLALYTACSGDEGSERHELAYRELHRYLYDIAEWHYPDVCDDATQSALLQAQSQHSCYRTHQG